MGGPGSNIPDACLAKAEQLGEQGCVLVTGACPGLRFAATMSFPDGAGYGHQLKLPDRSGRVFVTTPFRRQRRNFRVLTLRKPDAALQPDAVIRPEPEAVVREHPRAVFV